MAAFPHWPPGLRLLLICTPMSLSSSVVPKTWLTHGVLVLWVLFANVHDLAFLGVECHSPSCGPFHQFVHQ
jgi:hypothetical protein